MKKFIISNELLKAALKKLGLAVAKKPSLPAMQNVHCTLKAGSALFTATDLEITIQYACICEYAGEEISFLIPFDLIYKITQLNQDAPVTIEVHNDKYIVTCASDEYDISVTDKVDTFPKLAPVSQKNVVKLSREIIDCILTATSTTGNDEQRPALTFVCLDPTADHVTIASTDSHVLFTKKYASLPELKERILISPRVAKAIEGLENVSMHWHNKQVAFKSDFITVISTRAEHKYPDYKVVIPESKANLVLKRTDLIGVLEKCRLSASQTKNTTLKLKDKGVIKFEAIDESNTIKSELPGEYTGDTESITVNANWFLSLLKQIEYDDVCLAIQAPKKAIVVTSKTDADYLSLIIPLSA